MTKKVFIEAAELIKSNFPIDSKDPVTNDYQTDTRRVVANTFATLFARHNAQFNKSRFFEACEL